MRYADPDLIESLAAQYVLGTLQGPARRRFASLCETHPTARLALHLWEDRLLAMSADATAIRPSDLVWPRIQRRLRAAEATAPVRRSATKWWVIAAAASLAAVAFMLSKLVLQPPAAYTIAVLAQDATHPLWKIERSADLGTLTLKSLSAAAYAPARDYELWALSRSGGAPVSLGLLPAKGEVARILSVAQLAALTSSDKLAVSVEPVGGSPTGAPTGPVIIVAGIGKVG
jgi:anti-sigma-K factor RskA